MRCNVAKFFVHSHTYARKQQPSNKLLTTNALNKRFPPGTPRFTRASTNVTHVCLQRPRGWFAPMCFHIGFYLSEPGCELSNCSNRVYKRLAHHTSPRCAAMLQSSLFIATAMRYKQQPSNKLLTTNARNKLFPSGTPHFTRASTNITQVYLQRPLGWFCPFMLASTCLS